MSGNLQLHMQMLYSLDCYKMFVVYINPQPLEVVSLAWYKVIVDQRATVLYTLLLLFA